MMAKQMMPKQMVATEMIMMAKQMIPEQMVATEMIMLAKQMTLAIRCTFLMTKALLSITSLRTYPSKPWDHHTPSKPRDPHTIGFSSMADTLVKKFWAGEPFPRSGGGNVSKLAASVPQVRLTQDQSENNKRATARWSLVQLIDWAIKNPYQIQDVWNQVNSGLVGKAPETSENGASSEANFGSPSKFLGSTFGKVKTQTKALAMAQLQGGPTMELLNMIDDKDSGAVDDIFKLVTKFENSDKVPEAAQNDLNMFTKLALARAEAIGHRWREWFDESVNHEGAINWGKRPLFDLYYEDGMLQKVTHITGSVGAPPSHVKIGQDWIVYDPYSDANARFEIGENESHYLRGFFKSDEGPNMYKIDRLGKDLTRMCDDIAKKADEKKKELLAICNSPEAAELNRRKERLRRESLDKAREARVQRPTKRMRAITYGAPREIQR